MAGTPVLFDQLIDLDPNAVADPSLLPVCAAVESFAKPKFQLAFCASN